MTQSGTSGTASVPPSIRRFVAASSWLYSDDCRLDARSYAGGFRQAEEALNKSGLKLQAISTACGTMWHPVQNQARSNFKRIYTDPEFGTPFASSRSMFGFPLRPGKFLSKRMAKLNELMVPEGWLLVSRSGTVGNVLYVNRSLSECAISDHAIRLEPTDAPGGFLYAYLASSYGQRMLARNVFGATVEELEPKHIGAIPFPRLGPLETTIHELIVDAYRLRDEGSRLLLSTEKELYDILGLRRFRDSDLDYIGYKAGGPRAFKAWLVDGIARLDATHHMPVARQGHGKVVA